VEFALRQFATLQIPTMLLELVAHAVMRLLLPSLGPLENGLLRAFHRPSRLAPQLGLMELGVEHVMRRTWVPLVPLVPLAPLGQRAPLAPLAAISLPALLAAPAGAAGAHGADVTHEWSIQFRRHASHASTWRKPVRRKCVGSVWPARTLLNFQILFVFLQRPWCRSQT